MQRLIFALLPLAMASVTTSALAKKNVDLGDGWNLQLDGQYRTRMFVDSNRADLQDTSFREREFVTQRARLGVTATNAKGVSFTLRLQDVRMWGEEANTLNDFSADGFDAHEAYVTVPLYKNATLKMGRQEMVLDNARLVGNVGWVQRARAFDGGRVMWRGKKIDADLFFMVIGEDDNDGDRAQKPGVNGSPTRQTYFAGAHGDYKLSKALKASFAYYLRDNKATEETRHTAGLVVKGKASGAHYSVELYKQFGDLGSETIDAMMAAVNAGYTVKSKLAPGVSVWAELLSGDKDGAPQNGFDTLYATNHKFYGEMDYFLNMQKNAAGRGLMDVGGKVELKPSPRSKVHVAVHNFSLAEEDTAGEKALGTEVDTRFTYKTDMGIKFAGVYGILLPGKAMETVRGVPDPEKEHLVYLTTTFGF